MDDANGHFAPWAFLAVPSAHGRPLPARGSAHRRWATSWCRGASALSQAVRAPSRRGTLRMTATEPRTTRKLSPVEGIKARSQQLRHPLQEEMGNDLAYVTNEAVQVLKFHGTYQQDDRDKRTKGEQKKYQFMLRLKMPAGQMPVSLYKVLDDLSEQCGNHTLRATTRGTFQMHGVLKGDLKQVFSTIMNAGGSTLGACGDINRNVVATPAPIHTPIYEHARFTARMLAELLAPQSGAFAEIWLDGEKAASMEFWRHGLDLEQIRQWREHDNGRGQVFPGKEEPIYGETYMPRKFKIGVTVPGDNSIDVFTQDVGLVVVTDNKGNLRGYDVLVGGGMGRTHNKESTFARLADPLGFIPTESLVDCIKAIVAAQRDHGDREVRAHARLKYLVHKMGIDAFRKLVQSYMEGDGAALQPWQALPRWEYRDWCGWHEDAAGRFFLGLNIENGRIQGDLKTALRRVADEYGFPMVVTPHQNIVLCDIEAKQCQPVADLLRQHGVVTDTNLIDPLLRTSMACPALPLCGLAITEAERVMHSYVSRVRGLLDKVGLPRSTSMVMRMTGCPNGCSRPYMAELALVGSGPNGTYQLWLGGSPNQTRLAFPYEDRIEDGRLDAVLESVFRMYRERRRSYREPFGDFCARVGKQAIQEWVQTPPEMRPARSAVSGNGISSAPQSTPARPRITVSRDLYTKLKFAADARNVPVSALVNAVLEDFFKSPEMEHIMQNTSGGQAPPSPGP